MEFKNFLADLVGSARKNPQHVIVGDDIYTRVLRATAWPENPVSVGFLERLHALRVPANITVEILYRFKPVFLHWGWAMAAKQRRLVTKVQGEQMPAPSEVKALEALNNLRNASYYGGSDTADIWFYVILRSTGDPGTLDQVCRRISNDIRDLGIAVSLLEYEQPQAYRATFSLGAPDKAFGKTHQGRITTIDTTAALFPLLAGSNSDGRGVYIGHSVRTGAISLIDLKKGAENQNIIVLGASGEGKSVLQKSLINGMRLEGFLVVVFDMNGEYRKLCAETGGLYIDHTLSTGKYIDPLAISDKIGVREEDASRLTAVSDALLTTVSILAEGITPGERNAADRALMKLYSETGIDVDDPATWDFVEQPFDIEDWYSRLQADKDRDAANLAAKLAIYFTGSKRHLFRHSDKVTIPDKCSLVVFQVGSSLEGSDVQVGAAKMAMTMGFVRDVLRKEKLQGKRYTAVVFDEAQRLLLNPDMSNYINSLATHIRHLNGLVVIGTNKPHVFWLSATGGEGGTGIWANSKFKAFFWLENSEIAAIEKNAEIPREITDQLKLMRKTQQFLIRSDRGWDCLKVHLPPQEIELYATRGLRADDKGGGP
ncbi:MAG: DUF87 domain-containing protein [Bacillota bacterium]